MARLETISARPNLFIVGAMKSATTSLAFYLSGHPEIYLPSEKEPAYFVPVNHGRTLRSYEALYQPGGASAYRLDASTHYTKDPRLPCPAAKIQSYSPEARVIYIMRHPVHRAISHYWHLFRHGHDSRPPESAVINNPEYLSVSYYAYQLLPYLQIFGSRCYTLFAEDLALDANAEIDRIFKWLGLESVPVSIETKYYTTPRFFSMDGKTMIDRTKVPVSGALSYLRGVEIPRVAELESLLGKRTPWGLS